MHEKRGANSWTRRPFCGTVLLVPFVAVGVRSCVCSVPQDAPRSYRGELVGQARQRELDLLRWLQAGADSPAPPLMAGSAVASALASAPRAAAEVLRRWEGLDWFATSPYVQFIEAYGLNLTLINHDNSPDPDSVKVYDLLFHPVPPGGVALDVGSHVGMVAVFLAKLNPGSRIVAFEPAESNRFLVELNLAINGVPFLPSDLSAEDAPLPKAEDVGFVEVRGEAVAGSDGSRDFAFVAGDSDISGFEWGPWRHPLNSLIKKLHSSQYTRVSTITLKSAIELAGAEKIHFLKLDCEGCEFEAVPQLDEATLDRLLYVCGEYHNWLFADAVSANQTLHVICSRHWDLRADTEGMMLC